MQYVTPRRFRAMGLKVDLSNTSDTELRVYLEIASSKAETHCQVPEGHSFLGGTVIDETRIWHVGNTHNPGQRKVWPLHRPIKDVTALQLVVTNSQYVDIDVSSLYIDRTLDQVEVTNIALTSAAVFTTGLAPYIGLQKPRSRISYTYGWDIDEIETHVMYDSQPPGFELNLDNQFISDTLTVTKNGTTLTVTTDYEIDTYEGVLTLVGALARGDKLVVSYTHPLPSKIASATALIAADIVNWALQMEVGLGGLSGLRINEVEMRASKAAGFSNVPINPAAEELLNRFVYRGFGA